MDANDMLRQIAEARVGLMTLQHTLDAAKRALKRSDEYRVVKSIQDDIRTCRERLDGLCLDACETYQPRMDLDTGEILQPYAAAEVTE